MPYEFKIKENDGSTLFRCDLQNSRCTARNKNGNRCNRVSLFGFEMCWNHFIIYKHLRILPTEIPAIHGEKGLFAYDPNQPADAIIFRRGDVICDYVAERLTNRQKDERYEEHTAPYAIERTKKDYEDGACKRTIASIINHGTSPASRNCQFYLDRTARSQKVIVECTKNIRNNREILANYYAPDYSFDEDHETRYIRYYKDR